ncbi:MAG: DUF4162 domain-containing protein, partial [Candidatus Caldarchaeum sp.]
LADRVGMVYLGRTMLEGTLEHLLSRNGLRQAVHVVVKKQAGIELVSAIRRIEGVKEVQADGTGLTIELDGVNDPRDKIAETVVGSGYGLVEMKTSGPSLEQVFIKMVRNDTAG